MTCAYCKLLPELQLLLPLVYNLSHKLGKNILFFPLQPSRYLFRSLESDQTFWAKNRTAHTSICPDYSIYKSLKRERKKSLFIPFGKIALQIFAFQTVLCNFHQYQNRFDHYYRSSRCEKGEEEEGTSSMFAFNINYWLVNFLTNRIKFMTGQRTASKK